MVEKQLPLLITLLSKLLAAEPQLTTYEYSTWVLLPIFQYLVAKPSDYTQYFKFHMHYPTTVLLIHQPNTLQTLYPLWVQCIRTRTLF